MELRNFFIFNGKNNPFFIFTAIISLQKCHILSLGLKEILFFVVKKRDVSCRVSVELSMVAWLVVFG